MSTDRKSKLVLPNITVVTVNFNDCDGLARTIDSVTQQDYVNYQYLIVDEAQNLTKHEIKTIITRIGEGTKIVLTGDIEQIDNVYVNETSNGLVHAVEKFKEYSIAGHMTFRKGERSELATLASKVL